MKGRITKTGYRRNSPDVNNDFNIIPSNRISMQDVDFPVFGVDNMGNSQMMYPGGEYEFQGDYVTELPAYGSGGLTQWFAEKWVDIKTGKTCGRSGKDKKGRPYPACRPSKRVNSTTPKTTSELSAAEKAKFKREKKSGKRIDYNHKRAQEGGSLPSYQTRGEIEQNEKFNRSKTFIEEWTNSAMHDKMLNESLSKSKDWFDFNTYKQGRLQNIQTIPSLNISDSDNSFWAAESNANTGKITVYPSGLKKDVFTHEISHSSDRPLKEYPVPRLIPRSDNGLMKEYYESNTKHKNKRTQYIARPTETRARIMEIRDIAKQNKIYDPFTEKMSPEAFEKYLELEFNNSLENKADGSLRELQEVYTNDQILNLLNTISSSNADTAGLSYAQDGGENNYTMSFSKSERDFIEKWNDTEVIDLTAKKDPNISTGFKYGSYNDHYDDINLKPTSGNKRDTKYYRSKYKYWISDADKIKTAVNKTFTDPSIKYLEKYYKVGIDPDVNILPLDHFSKRTVDAYMEAISRSINGLKELKPGQEFELAGVAAEGVDPWGEITKDGKYAVINFTPNLDTPISPTHYTNQDEYATARIRIPLEQRKQEPLINLPSKAGLNNNVGVTPNMMVEPMLKIYSRKLNQQTGEYIYDTSKGIIRTKIGPEDARFYNQNKNEIENIRSNWRTRPTAPIKQLGGSLPTYQTQGEVLDEVTVTASAMEPRVFGTGYQQQGEYDWNKDNTQYYLPINLNNAGGVSKDEFGNYVFNKPGRFARQVKREFKNQFGINPRGIKSDFTKIFSQPFSTLNSVVAEGNNVAFSATRPSLSNSYYTNPYDNQLGTNRRIGDYARGYISNDRSALLDVLNQKGTAEDFRNLFSTTHGYRPYLSASNSINYEDLSKNWRKETRQFNKGMVDHAYIGEEEISTRSPFESNMINYLGSDAYFERLAGTQYADEIDLDRWSTDDVYRLGFANRLKSEKPELVDQTYASLTNVVKKPVKSEISKNLGNYASAANTHEHSDYSAVVDYNPFNFNTPFGGAEQRKAALIKELERRGANPAEIQIAMDYGIGPGMNDNFSDVMAHELGHVYSMGSKNYALGNKPVSGLDKEYQLLWNMNQKTAGKPFYSLDNHLSAGSKAVDYNRDLTNAVEETADNLNTEYHTISPEETKADVYGIRNYLLRTQGQDYDQPFTKENYESLMNDEKFKEGLFYKRMQERYGDDQSKWMKAMNLIAANEDTKSNTRYAQTGGQQGPPNISEGPLSVLEPVKEMGPPAPLDPLTKRLESINPEVKSESANGFYNPSILEGLSDINKSRRLDLLNAADKIAKAQGDNESLRRLLILTAAMENSLGVDSNAYGRTYTSGTMSLDPDALTDLFSIREGANDYTTQQKKNFKWIQSLGYADNEAFKQALRADDPVASVAAARLYYGTKPDALPPADDPRALYDYYVKNYNQGGLEKYQNNESRYKSFEQFYNSIYKKEGGESLPDYSRYDNLERAWFAARKDLGKGKMFMYGGQKHSTYTPKGL